MNPIRTLIADDYLFFRRFLKAQLEENCGSLVVGMAANGQIDGLGGSGIRSAPIPTLSQWSMIFLGLLMLLMGIRSLRRKGYGPSATA